MRVKLCPLAKKHHEAFCRQFAHVFHKRDTICVTPEFYNLPQSYQLGILLHEFGHIALRNETHTEEQADRIAFILSGAKVGRRTYRGMKKLEHVSKTDKAAALDFLREHIT